MDRDVIARPQQARLAELVFQWFAIAILMVVVGFGVQFWSYGGPSATLTSAEWLGRAAGMTIAFSAIPMYIAAWTHFKRPWLVLLTWAPIALLSSFGAVVLHEQNSQRQMASTVGQSQPAQWAQHTPQEQPTPPPGFTYSKQAAPASDSAQWDADASVFEAAHPSLKYGENYKIVQEKLEAVGGLGLDNTEMLNRAYAAALQDGRWHNGP